MLVVTGLLIGERLLRVQGVEPPREGDERARGSTQGGRVAAVEDIMRISREAALRRHLWKRGGGGSGDGELVEQRRRRSGGCRGQRSGRCSAGSGVAEGGEEGLQVDEGACFERVREQHGKMPLLEVGAGWLGRFLTIFMAGAGNISPGRIPSLPSHSPPTF